MKNSSQPQDVRVIIKGAGGQGVVVADILLKMNRGHFGIKPVGFIDDDPLLHGKTVCDLEVFGSTLEDVRSGYDAVVVAIGKNRMRANFFEQFQTEGKRFATCKHTSAIIAEGVGIGPGTMICAGVIVNPAAKIGENVILNTGCTIDHHDTIDDHAHIAPGVNLGGEVVVGEGALIGIGASVLPGVKIGRWSVIGGGAVVTGDVPDGAVYCGVPAVPRKL
jgi:acetyltransferase EpsM